MLDLIERSISSFSRPLIPWVFDPVDSPSASAFLTISFRSSTNLPTSIDAVMWVVSAPANVSVPTFRAFFSQARGWMPSESNVMPLFFFVVDLVVCS